MLARLGQALSQQGINVRDALAGEKLAEFVSREMAAIVQILTSPSDPLTKGLVPANVIIDADLSQYFRRPETLIPPRENRVIFNRQVWDAFCHPVPVGHFRIAFLDPEIKFEDIPKGTEKAGQVFVPVELVVVGNILPRREREVRMYENILQWAQSNSIELDKLKGPRNIRNETEPDSVWSVLLRTIDKNDLHRVSIPMDIVVKLQNTKFRPYP